MGIDLVSQIIHFRLQVLTFELLHLLFVAQGAVQQFDTHVQTRHEESQQDVPVDRQIGERRFAIQNVRLGVVRNVFFIDGHQRKDRCNGQQVDDQIPYVTMFSQQQPGGDQAVVNDENKQIGRDFEPGDQDILQADLYLREHFRVEHGYQDYHRPYQQVQKVFSDHLFAAEFHVGKYTNKP